MTTPSPTVAPAKRRRGVLDLIEFIGNKLPDPAIIFMIGAALVIALSAFGAAQGWSVEELRPVVRVDDAGQRSMILEKTGTILRPVSLMSADGVYWMISTMVSNFINFPPLGIVLVGMLGIGVAERTGMIEASLKAMMLVTPLKLLTPMMVFLGVLSSLGSDAGYIILPPLAAALYKSVGRSPLAGIAAVFAGVSGGFSANFFPSGGDVVMAGLTNVGAHIIDPGYNVVATANIFFMSASVFLLTFVGWAVTAWFVEPRLANRTPEEGGPSPAQKVDLSAEGLSGAEKRGLLLAFLAIVVTLGIGAACIFAPGWPLYGKVPGGALARWPQGVVPLVFFAFLAPGVAYGVATGTVKKGANVIHLMVESMKAMGPIIVLAFFAAQFIGYFNHSNIGRMMAMAGGEALASAEMPQELLILVFVALSAFFNLFIGSMSAKYAILAPIFVPMFMLVGISPEMTQMSYRIGDSVTNIITPLNSYMVIILVVMQRFAPKGGMGTMIAMMLPYTVCFLLAWSAMIIIWLEFGWDLGIGGPLQYVPSEAISAPAAP
ncbi:MAG: AbgT family transporter [Phycisphaerales bacterium]|nr:AbgT family transporter [Phycisphaerales bacterium]